MSIRVGVLGPVRIEIDGIERPVTARRQRAVLACLILNAGEAVSADRILEDVWVDDQPDSGVRAVAYQISKLRSLLEPDRASEGSMIATVPAGYVLNVEPDHIDAREFDRLVDLAREALSTDPIACQVLVEQALSLRRGRPFADLDAAFVEVESRRLEGRYLLARRTLAEARIAQGHPADVIGALEVMVAQEPLEEAVAELLMVALHRSGRTAEALRAYGDLRRRLGSELGIEPSGRLRQLEHDLLAGEPPALVPVSGAPRKRVGNLPTPLSSFVGRDDEIREISELLSTSRLVSLLSFGGVGKTRLAIEVAANIADRFVDGVWFVDLVPITDPMLLADTFVNGIGLPSTGNRDQAAYVIAQLSTRESLIVVDNCEHLIDEVGDLVGRLVLAAPNVRVLATSRLSLGVRDEVVWRVQPLAVSTAAFELFAQRARLVRPGFVVDDSNRAAIEQICEALDGIPLAIELASARLKTMTVGQIAGHLEDRFRLLTRPERTADARQGSLLATMTWSYELLDGPDRELLRRLSVFTDGFSLEAATMIGGGQSHATVDVLDSLDRLVDASLISFVEKDGTTRYRMLETVREFAAGQLGHDDRDQLGLSHATYFDTIASRIAALRFDDHDASMRLGDQELGNLRSAVTWSFTHAHYRLGMSIAAHLWRYFWEQPTGGNENVRWGRTALEMIDEDDDEVLLVAAGTVIEAYNLGDREAETYAVARVRRGLVTADDPVVTSRLLTALSTSVLDSDPRAAETLLDDAWDQLPLQPRSIDTLNNYIELSWLSGTLRDGAAILERLGEVGRLLGDLPPTAVKVEAGVAACAGQWRDVLRLTETRETADKMAIDLSLLRSEALGVLGQIDDALALVKPPQDDDYPSDVQRIYLIVAWLHLARSDPSAALDRLFALVKMINADQRRLALGMHVASLLAVTACELEQYETAAILFGFATAEQDRLDIVVRSSQRPLTDSASQQCRERIGQARFSELGAQGAATEFAELPLPAS